jgi:hypothetical protein
MRWPLQPHSHDHGTALGDVVTARWQLSRHPGSRAGPLPFFSGEADFATLLSLDALADGITRRPSLRARPPFTRPCRSFWSAFAELIRGQTPPTDFCNVSSTCEQPNPGS